MGKRSFLQSSLIWRSVSHQQLVTSEAFIMEDIHWMNHWHPKVPSPALTDLRYSQKLMLWCWNTLELVKELNCGLNTYLFQVSARQLMSIKRGHLRLNTARTWCQMKIWVNYKSKVDDDCSAELEMMEKAAFGMMEKRGMLPDLCWSLKCCLLHSSLSSQRSIFYVFCVHHISIEWDFFLLLGSKGTCAKEHANLHSALKAAENG